MKKLLAMILALAMVLSLAACGSSSSADETSSEPAAASEEAAASEDAADDASGESLTIAYSSAASSALAIWSGFIESSLKAECDARGWEFKPLSAEGDVELQGEQITQLISMDPDYLVIFPVDPATCGDWAEEAADAGIPVIVLAQDVPEEAQQYVTAYVGYDQYNMCYDLAQYIIDANGADAGLNIVTVSGVPVQQDYIDREGGFNDCIADNSNYNVLATEYAFSSRSDAKTIMENYISAYGADGIDVVVAYEDDLLMGVIQAVDEAGLTGKVQVYGVAPCMQEAVDAINAGTCLTDYLMRASDMTAEAANIIETVSAGGSVEYYHEIPLYFVTADNTADYADMIEY